MASTKKKKFNFKKWHKKIFRDNDFVFYTYTYFLSIVGYLYLKFVLLTSQITYDIKADKSLLKKENSILGFWHGRLLSPLIVRKYFGSNASFLVSTNRSAYLVKLICKYFGVDKIEGSTGKGGFNGVRAIMRFLKNRPATLAIAPDGSIGPRMQCSEGIVSLAQITKTPIMLLSFSSSQAIIINSWDRFFLPLPFSKIEVHVSEVLPYNKFQDGEEFRLFIENYLNNKTWELDEKYKQPKVEVAEYGRKGVSVKTRHKHQKK